MSSSLETGTRGRTPGVLAILGLGLLAALLWFHRIEFDAPNVHRTLIQSDTYRYFHPVAEFIHNEVNAGRLPLWNPYQMAGQPFLALPVTGALYPLNLVIMGLFEANTALGVHAVLHFFLAGLFTALLARRLGLGLAPSSAAALAYMLSGPMLLGLYMSVHFSTQAWLPAILWALHGLLSEARMKWALALALFASLTCYGGYPQLFLYIAQFGGLFALGAFFFLTPPGARLRVVLLLGLSGAVALGWMMPLLLPQLEFTQEASRSLQGLSLEQASFPFISTNALVDGATRDLVDAAVASPAGPVMGRVALPALFLPLALCGLLVRGSRGYWIFFAVSALGTGLLMLGPQSPVFEAYYRLPLTALFRGPIRLAFLYAFCAAMLLGLGVQGLTTFVAGRRTPGWAAPVLGFVLVFIIAGDAYMRTRLNSAHPSSHENARGAPKELIDFLRARPGRERIYFETRHLYAPGFLLKAGSMNEIFIAGDYEPSLYRGYLDYFEYTGSTPWHGNSTILTRDRPHAAYIDPQLLDLMSVRFYGALEPGNVDQIPQLRERFGRPRARLGSVKVYETESALPRAYTVEHIHIASDQATAIRAIRDESFSPRTMAVVSGTTAELPPTLVGWGEQAEPEAPTLRESRITHFSPQAVVIETDCPKPCLAVLTDLDYPGWQAEVDGIPTPIVRVNGLFRGVGLAPGKHVIAYRFAPESFSLGLWIALGASALGLAAWVADRRWPHGVA